MSDLIPIGTDEQCRAVAKVAEMGTETVKAATKAGGWVASIVQDVPKDLIGVMGGDWLHHARQRNLARLEANTAALLEKIAADRRTEPSPSVLVPLLTAAVDETRSELQDIWARLLANAMIDGGHKVRRDFFDTVKRMEPIDALLLRACYLAPKMPNTDALHMDIVADQMTSCLKRPFGPLDQDVSVEALVSLRCLKTSAMATFLSQYGESLMISLMVD